MKYCYFVWALSLTLGILIFDLFASRGCSIKFIFIISAILISFLTVIAGFVFEKKYSGVHKADKLFLIFTSVLFLLMGFISSNLNFLNNSKFKCILSDSGIFSCRNIEIVADGRVTGEPFQKFGKTYFDFEIDRLKIIQSKNGSFRELNKCGNIFISCKDSKNSDLHLNDFIQVSLTGMNIYAGRDSYIFNAGKITICNNKESRSYFRKLKSELYRCLESLFDKNLNATNSKIASALILGNQSGIPEKAVTSFKESGIYHLLAISGLHISIMTAFICFVFKKIIFSLTGRKIRISYFILIFIIFYNFIVGAKASMLRASIMSCLALFAKEIHKDFLSSNMFFTAYIVLLLIYPDYLINPGFILSFASVAAIIFSVPFTKRTLKCFSSFKELNENYLVKSIIVSVSVNIFIFPVLSYYFGSFSVISIITNLLVAPLFYVLLLDLFISSVFAIFWFTLGSFCIIPAGILTDAILKISDFLVSLPYSFINTNVFDNKFIVLMYYAGLIILSGFLRRLVRRKEVKNNTENDV